MKLFGSLTSPFVRKIRVILIEKSLNYDFVLEDVWSATTTISTLNPLGKVPCLILDNGKPVYDSKVISEALEKLYPSPSLMPTDTSLLIDMRNLEALGDGMMEAAVSMFLENKFHTEEKRSEEWLKRQEKKILDACKVLSALVEASSTGFLQAQFSVADISVVSALCYVELRLPHLAWRSMYPRLNQYVNHISERESLSSTKPNS